MTKIIVIPDTQVKADVCTDHIEALGNYIGAHRPDRIVHLGDHFDMPSLNTHSPRSSIEFHGASYQQDLEAGWEALNRLTKGFTRGKHKSYHPDMHFCMGNHEYRRDRLIKQEPYLQGALDDYGVNQWGFKEHKFLQPVRLDGINFCHYAQGGAMGRPIGRANRIATQKHESWIVGHQQVLDIYLSPHVRTDGSRVQCVIAGAFYSHDEGYMHTQGNTHWRGALMLTECNNGSFDFVSLSLDYLTKEWL